MPTNQTWRSLISYQYNAILAALALLASNQLAINDSLAGISSQLEQINNNLGGGGPIATITSEVEKELVDYALASLLTQDQSQKSVGELISTIRDLSSLISGLMPGTPRPTQEQLDELIFEVNDLNCAIHRCAQYDDDTFGPVVPALKTAFETYSEIIPDVLPFQKYRKTLDYTGKYRSLILSTSSNDQDNFLTECNQFTLPVAFCDEDSCEDFSLKAFRCTNSQDCDCDNPPSSRTSGLSSIHMLTFDPYTLPLLRELDWEMAGAKYTDMIYIGNSPPVFRLPSLVRIQYIEISQSGQVSLLHTCGETCSVIPFVVTSSTDGFYVFHPFHILDSSSPYVSPSYLDTDPFSCQEFTSSSISHAVASLLSSVGICDIAGNVTYTVQQQNSRKYTYVEEIARKTNALNSGLNSDFSNITFADHSSLIGSYLYQGAPLTKGTFNYILPNKFYSYEFYDQNLADIFPLFEVYRQPSGDLDAISVRVPGDSTPIHIVCGISGDSLIGPNACVQFLQEIKTLGGYDHLIFHIISNPVSYELVRTGAGYATTDSVPTTCCPSGTQLFNDFGVVCGVKQCSSEYCSDGEQRKPSQAIFAYFQSYGSGPLLLFDTSVSEYNVPTLLIPSCCSQGVRDTELVDEISSAINYDQIPCPSSSNYFSSTGNLLDSIYDSYSVPTIWIKANFRYDDVDSIIPATRDLKTSVDILINSV